MFDLTWHESAACKSTDHNLFYVDEAEEPDVIAALRPLCDRCLVFDQCREHSLTWEQYGFWANLTESERANERRRLRITRRSVTRVSTKGAGYGTFGNKRQ